MARELGVIIYAVEQLDGAEQDCFVVDSLWDTREKAEKYAKEHYQQSGWGCPVPTWSITEYELNRGS